MHTKPLWDVERAAWSAFTQTRGPYLWTGTVRADSFDAALELAHLKYSQGSGDLFKVEPRTAGL